MQAVADQFAHTFVSAAIKRVYGFVGDNLRGALVQFADQFQYLLGSLQW